MVGRSYSVENPAEFRFAHSRRLRHDVHVVFADELESGRNVRPLEPASPALPDDAVEHHRRTDGSRDGRFRVLRTP